MARHAGRRILNLELGLVFVRDHHWHFQGVPSPSRKQTERPEKGMIRPVQASVGQVLTPGNNLELANLGKEPTRKQTAHTLTLSLVLRFKKAVLHFAICGCHSARAQSWA